MGYNVVEDSRKEYYKVSGLSLYILKNDCKVIEPQRGDDVPLSKEERPTRYASREVHGMDVIDLIKYWGLNFNQGSILKYLLRNKGEDIEDMAKIEDYARREKEHLNKL